MPYSRDDEMLNRPSLRVARFICAGLLSVLVSACGSGPPAKLYLLEAPLEKPVRLRPAVVQSLGLATVELPGYARDPEIAMRADGSRIVLDREHRWAEPPADAITRVLGAQLQHHAGTTVVIEPLPRGYDPSARVEVVFDRLLREPDGGADLAGQVRLLSGDGRRVLLIRAFRFVHRADSSGPSAFFSATALGLNDLARMVTELLRPA